MGSETFLFATSMAADAASLLRYAIGTCWEM